MADADDASVRKRDSHYNHQRSSLRSDRPHTPSRPNSRPVSSPWARDHTLDYALEYDYASPPLVPGSPDSASPAPNVPRMSQRKRSLDRTRARSKSTASYRLGSPQSAARPDSGRRTGVDDAGHLPGRATPGAVSDITALPPIRRPENSNQPSHSRFATELYSISYLILFSILGTLARLGLQWLTFYPGTPSIFPVLWANFAGTLFMGFLSQDRRLFREEWGHPAPSSLRTLPSDEEKAPEESNQAAKAFSHTKVKKTIPLYIGLATGFCGSLTSFSNLIRDVFLAFVNHLSSPATDTPLPRSGGYSFMAGLAIIIITIAVCFFALELGRHTSILLDRFTPTVPFRLIRKLLDPFIVFLGWTAWLGAIIMVIWPPDRPSGPASKGSWSNETWRGQALFACVFAPLGCILRFYLSLLLNPFVATFPLGTFTVNIFGTAVLGMAYDLQHVEISGSGVGGGRVACQLLQGLMDGFCGCLTTVSTWMLELKGLRSGHAYKYAFASVAAGVAVLVVIMGSVKWSVGWTEVACVI